jgi:hypothetical protein
MRSKLNFLSFFACLCLLGFGLGCNQNKKDTSQLNSKKIAQDPKKTNHSLKPDSAKIINDSLTKAYNMLPKIYLPFFPSSPTVNCKQLVSTYLYASTDIYQGLYVDGQTYLGTTDTAFLISKLKNKRPLIVNPEGGTSFGTLDYRASTDTLDDQNDMQNTIDDVAKDNKIGVVWAKKVDDAFMCYIMIKGNEWYGLDLGILILITQRGNILDWMPVKGSKGVGNPHGSIERNFAISPNNTITIKEDSYGDNSDIYEFYANYVVKNKRFVLQKRKLRMIKSQEEK